MATALIDQFARLRDGDRFFYLNDNYLHTRNIEAVIDLNDVTLAHIIKLNTAIDELPHNAFSVPEPLTLYLLAIGLGGIVFLSRRCFWIDYSALGNSGIPAFFAALYSHIRSSSDM